MGRRGEQYLPGLTVNAGRFPTSDQWWWLGGETFTKAALHVASCDAPLARVADVLVYNREGNMSITNTHEVAQLLQVNGLTTTVVTATGNSPRISKYVSCPSLTST